MWRVEEYVREDGSIPYREWLSRLDPQAAAKVGFATMRLAQGNTSNLKWFQGISEYVINWGPGVSQLSCTRLGEGHRAVGWWYQTSPAD